LVAGSGSEGRLSVFQLDLQTGVLEPRSTNMTGPAPAYAAFHPNGRFLYSVAEGDNTTELEAYSVDRQTLALTRIGRAPSGNRGNTAHVSVHKSGRWAFAAHYNRGFVAALPILDDGGLGMARVRSTGESSQPHQILDDGVSGNFVFVPALIANQVFQFRFDSITGMLTPNTPDSVFLGMGVQPRHMTFHHSRRFAYVFTEGGVNAHSVFSFRYDSTTGLLTENGPPVDGTPPNTGGNGAHILAHPSKDFLYTSNREFGNSTIGVFRIAADGRPEGRVDVRDGLQQPWDFAIDPTGTFLVVASAGNGLVKVFRIDQVTGMLTAVGSGVSFPNPHFVGFMP
jgi:6-phosphogluconolactonase